MSLWLVAACVVGYILVVMFVMALLMASKRADEAAARQWRALVRSRARGARTRFVREADAAQDAEPAREKDAEPEIVVRRRAG